MYQALHFTSSNVPSGFSLSSLASFWAAFAIVFFFFFGSSKSEWSILWCFYHVMHELDELTMHYVFSLERTMSFLRASQEISVIILGKLGSIFGLLLLTSYVYFLWSVPRILLVTLDWCLGFWRFVLVVENIWSLKMGQGYFLFLTFFFSFCLMLVFDLSYLRSFLYELLKLRSAFLGFMMFIWIWHVSYGYSIVYL